MDRLRKTALRLSLASSENLEPYEVILAEDRSQFDSVTLRDAFVALPEQVQRQIQVGYQFVGRYAYHPVVIAEYAEAHFGRYSAPLPLYITYLTSKFEKFKERVIEISQSKIITPTYSFRGGEVFIPEFRCRVLSENYLISTESCESLRKFFGYNMNVAICETYADKLLT